jgi:hypothetical protein
MDCQLCQRMRDLPIKQNLNPLKEGPPILNHHCPRNMPILADSNGSDNRPPQTLRQGHHPNHCRPWMLPRSSIHPLQHKHHWYRDCPTVPRTCVQMVQSTHQDNHQPRPTVYLPLRVSPYPETGNQAEPVFCIPPPNRRNLRKKEPMGGTIPAPSNLHGP